MAQVDTHVATIDPPSPHRLTWLAVCSFGDFSQSYRNRVEAYDACYQHIKDAQLFNSLEQGTYQFDDGEY